KWAGKGAGDWADNRADTEGGSEGVRDGGVSAGDCVVGRLGGKSSLSAWLAGRRSRARGPGDGPVPVRNGAVKGGAS
ncbi:hypothetical protein, partial [Bordetella bronchialis]